MYMWRQKQTENHIAEQTIKHQQSHTVVINSAACKEWRKTRRIKTKKGNAVGRAY